MSGSELPAQKVEPIRLFPYGYRELLVHFNNINNRNKQGELPQGELLEFSIEKTFESPAVYNPTKPVIIGGQSYIWARVDRRKNKKDSTVMLFKEENGKWNVVKEAPVFKNLQDPFYCGMIDGNHVLGGVQVYDVLGSLELGYKTVFFRYDKKSFTDLANQNGNIGDPFAVGPEGMKGIRLIQLKDGGIGVFTRPQEPTNKFGERGQIGYFEIKSLDELKKALEDYDQLINRNTLIQGLFIDKRLSLAVGLGDGEWGGANELFILPGGKIGVLGHIAGFGDKSYIAANGKKEFKKDYYPITFIFDPKDKSVSNVQIIATAKQFPQVDAGKDDLGSVIYSGGLMRLGDGTAWLYVGLGDSKAGRIKIKDPF